MRLRLNLACCCLLLLTVALLLVACGPSESEVRRNIEHQRIEKLHILRSQISSSFTLGSLVFICISFFGPTLAEKARASLAKQFHLSETDQVSIAKVLYWLAAGTVALMAVFNEQLGAVRQSVFLLLGATAYPFFVHVVPSIRTGDKLRRKAAVVQIKSFLMLIFIFYVILQFLSPEGFGRIQAT